MGHSFSYNAAVRKRRCAMSDKSITTNVEKEFFENLQAMGDNLSVEDLNVAIESLITYRKRKKQKEKAERKKREEQERLRAEKEHAEKVTSMDLPLDWENSFATSEAAAGIHAESLSDGLIICLNALGKVDIEYISEITGLSCKDVIEGLRGSIYQNPETWNECFYKGWETADEYLSGNMVSKWKAAKAADIKYYGYFSENLKAIERVMPTAVNHEDIYVSPGTPWVPAKFIDDFIVHLVEDHEGVPNIKRHYYMSDSEWNAAFCVRHNEETGSWDVPEKGRYSYSSYSYKVNSTYGTSRMNALVILEKTLNGSPVIVKDEVSDANSPSGVKKVINQSETLLAQQKQKLIVEEFQKWIWTDDSRKNELEEIYESKFSCFRARHYDGSFLTFPQMSKSVTLYDYQKDAVARMILSPNTLLAHDVGAGKTYEMVAAGMEMRRMGISKKNLYVVPNNIVGQWEKIFTEIYPVAKLLVVEPKSFTPDKRYDTLCKIRCDDYDGIIMAYSCFDNINISKEEEEEELNGALLKYQNVSTRTRAVSAKIRSIKKALDNLITSAVEENSIYFDELGINTLFVDEAHNYKNISCDSSFAGSIKGVSSGASKKCDIMMKKVNCVQKQNNGRGVIFATGTPVTNSVTDLYTMQKYLQSGTLALLEIDSFKAWCGMFAEKQDEFEVDVDTSEYRIVTRFSKFHNLPELTSLVSAIADFHSLDKSTGLPDFEGYDDSLIGKTPAFDQFLRNISNRVDLIRLGVVNRREDNMLKVTVDGRKAALDMRLADSNAAFDYNSKVYSCAEKVFDIYIKTAADKSAQLIFCDSSTPKQDFNIYDEMARLLTGMGIPREDIAFIHDAGTEKAREKLFAKVRRGEIRVLLGSTFKLGLGVNIQDKLIALHHLDVPWRPADMVQREGRILRQGNSNDKIGIYRYITEGSFDAYSWQLLETKQKFICDLLSGSVTERSGSEISDTVLNYGEVKALAVGNPLIKKRLEVANELSRYRSLQRKVVENRQTMESELASIPGKIAAYEKEIENAAKDAAFVAENPIEYDKEARKVIREAVHEAITDNVLMPAEKELMEYRGFKIVLPANMAKEQPFVWLVKNGRYYVETGKTETGALIRIDNRIDSFAGFIEKRGELISKLKDRKTGLESELLNPVNYTDEIEKYKALVEKYDEELGVDKK